MIAACVKRTEHGGGAFRANQTRTREFIISPPPTKQGEAAGCDHAVRHIATAAKHVSMHDLTFAAEGSVFHRLHTHVGTHKPVVVPALLIGGCGLGATRLVGALFSVAIYDRRMTEPL